MSNYAVGAQEARALIGRWRGGFGGAQRGFGGGQRGGWGGADLGVSEQFQPLPGGGFEVTQEQWLQQNPGGDWWERERRRHRWEQQNPGVPFVGAEALVGAYNALVGAAAAGHAEARGMLAEIAAANGIAPRAVMAPYPEPTLASRQGLPMNSGQQTFDYLDTYLITSRPQRQAFRPERVFISPPIGGTAGPAAWFVNDITIGNQSQLVQSGGLPGDMFGAQSIDSFVTFITAQTAMDVTMSVTLIESGIETAPSFYGGIIGTAAING